MTSSKRSRPSALALDNALEQAGYNGPRINLGLSTSQLSGTVNNAEAIGRAVNKRTALQVMSSAGVLTPLIPDDAWQQIDTWPVVARPDFHSMGRHIYMCHDQDDITAAFQRRRHPATHVQTYLSDGEEYRCHVVNGLSIKLSRKVDGGNHAQGATFTSAPDMIRGHRRTIRDVSKRAVVALGLDFGAVDLIYWHGLFYVLEVNTAPCLSDPQADTLERYVRAFTAGTP